VTRSSLLLAASLAVWISFGCATYTEQIEAATAKVSVGDYPAAIADLDDFLGVDSDEELPESWGPEQPLAILERGSLLQAVANYPASARDLSAGETELELLDYSADPEGTLGKYLYSDSAQDYQTPPTERLALSAVNMANYLAVGDWNGAAV
jgi:hypothetical protein